MRLDQFSLREVTQIDTLENFDLNKKKKLINNALKEFSNQGFKKASLNTILSESNISKGSFYHHFKNKKELYHYLFDFGIKIVMDKLNTNQVLEVRDFIKRLQVQAQYKIEVSLIYPHLFQFLGHYYKTMSHEEYVTKANQLTNNFVAKFLSENIDYSLFKDDIPKDTAMKVVTRYSSQIQREIEEMNLTDISEIMTYYVTQLEDIRTILYKKG